MRFSTAAFVAFTTLALRVWAADAPPRIFTSDPADLVAARAAYKDKSNPALTKFVDDLVAKAEKQLAFEPVSVLSKAFTPPSGDKHDYASLSPYWWPDPSKPDGKPYVRRDGEYNPERAKYDLDPMDKMTKAVTDLSLAYYFTGDERFAEKVATLVRTFFLDPQTKMNPNLRYAQFVPGLDIIRPSGVLEGNRFRRVVDGVGLIAGSKHWTAEDDAALKKWFGELLDYLVNSDQGKEEARQANNHGTWYYVQAGTYALYAGDEALAKKLVESAFKGRIEAQFQPDGLQPEEVTRTQSFHYHRYNLLALFDLAMLGDRVGLDLWNYKTADGKSLRLGLDFLTPYALGQKQWPHQQIHETKGSDMAILLRRAANAYQEPTYEQAAQKLKNDEFGMLDLLYPAKMK